MKSALDFDWIQELDNAVTICDPDGTIIYMNQKSIETFANSGGEDLIGKNLLDCHPEPSKSKLKRLIENRSSNTYFVSKNGKKKLIHQMPIYSKGIYKGMAEISIEIPSEVQTFERL